MPIPFDLTKTFTAAAALSKRERARAEKRRRAEAEADRAAARREREQRRAARPAARAIMAWVSGPEAEQLRRLARSAALPDVDLTGPLFADGESSSGGLRSGCWAISLITTGKAGLRATSRHHPMGGRRLDLFSAAAIAKVPPAVVHRLARDLDSGDVWRRLRREVSDVGALVRRWRDEDEQKAILCPWKICSTHRRSAS